MSTARPSDPRVSIRRVGPEDWEIVRDLRLRALRDAPAAFESTYEGEQGRSEKEWRAWLTRPTGVTVVATLNGQPAGLAGGYVEEAGHVELVSMWVTPSARGSGTADALVAEVVQWARMRDAHEVRLWVTRGNDVAERLYSRHGFVHSGQAQPLPPTHPCVDEIGMLLVLPTITRRERGPPRSGWRSSSRPGPPPVSSAGRVAWLAGIWRHRHRGL
jgi:GNAT superfamily N-acetyltransferase